MRMMPIDRMMASNTADRAVWAAAIRAPVENHPKALAFGRSTARNRAVVANRRAGKTECAGRELAARAIENDGYIVWVFAGDFDEYSRNWLDRRPGGLAEILGSLGVPAKVTRVGAKQSVMRIAFPWASEIRVFSASTAKQADTALGGRLHVLLLDEAQKLQHLKRVLFKIVAPALADYGGEVWLTGTPGTEIDSFFAAASTGQLSTYEVHRFFSWDNPHFGASFAERYRRAVLDTLETHADGYQLSAAALEWLGSLTEEQACDIQVALAEENARRKRENQDAIEIDDGVLMELFGVWTHSESLLIYKSVIDCAPYWGEFSPVIDRRHTGKATLQDLLDEPYGDGLSADEIDEAMLAEMHRRGDAVMVDGKLERVPRRWLERVEALPKIVRIEGRSPERKRWFVSFGIDFGFENPSGFWGSLWSPEDPSDYELTSGKAAGLGEDEQLLVIQTWVRAAMVLGLELYAVTADASGGEATAVTKTWDGKLYKAFGMRVLPAEKYRMGGKLKQIVFLNNDIRAGRRKFLRRSPAAIELQHLQWKPREDPDQKRKVHKDRQVMLPGGVAAVLGDHVADIVRYEWMTTAHVLRREPPPQPMSFEERHAERVARALGGMGV